MRVIVAGGRDFNNYTLMYNEIKALNLSPVGDSIICGGAQGADLLGAIIGKVLNIPVEMFPADWEKYGKSAGIIRNHQMGDYADFLLAFWDGKSHGTKDMITYMQQIGKQGRVIMYEH